MTIVLRITRSQQMALLDILITYSRLAECQLFVDCSSDPPVETTLGDLIAVVGDLKEVEL